MPAEAPGEGTEQPSRRFEIGGYHDSSDGESGAVGGRNSAERTDDQRGPAGEGTVSQLGQGDQEMSEQECEEEVFQKTRDDDDAGVMFQKEQE